MTLNTKLFKNIELIFSNKPNNYSRNTMLTYHDRISWVKKMLNIKSNSLVKILCNPNIVPIIDASDISVSTKKGTYISLYSISKRIKVPKKKMEEYRLKMVEYNNHDNKLKGSSKIVDKNNWCAWEDIEDIYNMIIPDSIDKVQDKLIIGLYTKLDGYICRLDFGEIIASNSIPLDKNHNYIYWDNNNYIICLNKYKTQHIYGSQQITVKDKDLTELIRMKLKDEDKYLLTNYKDKNKPLTSANLGKRITLLCDKYLGKHITLNTIRQIGETKNMNDPSYIHSSVVDKAKVHNKLQHSFMMGHYYAKNENL